MEFQKQQAIYLQIGESICDSILEGKWAPGEKIPSVREMAVSVEVNPNTVMRTYTDLQEKGIIFNKRGIGFFVSKEAESVILAQEKQEFIEHVLPRVFRAMSVLNISIDELGKRHQAFTKFLPEEEGKV
ncbi:MAG: GntR family transcriptional regulator [Deltaproteobacteria bacterium]|nr:GntR family transcriptional regulator [Deltaproteobacteria bacterium]